MLTRRAVVALLAAGAIAPAASAHTMFNQWVVFRRKHLLVGSHRKDIDTFVLAQEIVAALEHLLPEASARAARAPHPERLASLLGTGQLELAVLSRAHVAEMLAGAEAFSPYGAIPLTLIADLGSHLFVAHRDFPARHAWMVSAVLADIALGIPEPPPGLAIALHPGAGARLGGVALDDLTGTAIVTTTPG